MLFLLLRLLLLFWPTGEVQLGVPVSSKSSRAARDRLALLLLGAGLVKREELRNMTNGSAPLSLWLRLVN